ncbi:uncharacterized protein YbjT (DUF2867 family) [Halarchaeum rubridurum]|uniref:Uncharacterized protein YbjT (DUF2867 family) n=1 Tax=Halarchaeum rubridurum TaxID=489911 RepID=A0A830FU66_9EURY|nr:NmrA family NAD(P)-binding protein [Halarchaeum rubridurum]MBP1954530.1 uncharacterized protein YbjT (DUF2867 family) [Halarchaeum rubridurum]GGM61867.1 hypothetical protein GCM10009017_09860 [Halarchaeum rubridurum]
MRVLVTGATGRYGYAAALALRESGVDVTALVRDPNTDVARDLTSRGVRLARGRRDQLDHVEDALADADGLFLAVGGPGASARTTAERAEALVRAADRTDATVVHASLVEADARPGVPLVDVRGRIDADLASRGVTHVSLRPGVPLDAFERARDAVETEGRLSFPLDGHARVPLTDPRDVGRAAAAAFTDSRPPAGERLPVVSGTHSLYDVADVLEALLGRSITADPRGPTAAPRSLTAFYRWANEGALLGVDADALPARYGVDPAPIRDYFGRAGWR